MTRKTVTSPTEAFASYVRKVDASYSTLVQAVSNNNDFEHLLNGAAAEAVEKFVAKDTRSANGIFFSGKEISKLAVSLIAEKLSAGQSIGDPACGAGDLLIACARHFEIKSNLDETLCAWTDRIVGLDIHKEFTSATRSRLRLLAASRHTLNSESITEHINSKKPFYRIRTGDYFENVKKLANVDLLIMNPPFVTGPSPVECTWSSGNIQLAGIFLDKALQVAKAGQEIVAILPDVLRSGARYARWRDNIEENSLIKNIISYGRFDSKTDVDVFIIHLKKEKKSTRPAVDWKDLRSQSTKSKNLSDFFNVSVGSYVPFRAKEDKRVITYVCVKSAVPDSDVAGLSTCNFDGRLHKTPFVVVRRTSNPSDTRRVVPSLVTWPELIAVENHLLVLSPIDGSLSTCKKLMESLKDSEVDAWMNVVTRCRHLTAGAMKLLPLKGWI
jgi:hypothetical protein